MARLQNRTPPLIAQLENAMELLLAGRLSKPYQAPYRVVRQQRNYAIRHYGETNGYQPGERPPALFVPPLMVTSEVFDIDPSISAVQALIDGGVDVWLIDFGAPEQQEGGMERTLRDHVLAISETVDEIVTHTKRAVHLIGYSQGGMFVYEAAAYRRCEGVASAITFGSPVDFHRAIPSVGQETAGPLLRAAVTGFERAMDSAKGFSSSMTAGGFRVVGVSKELGQLVQFFRMLDNRIALERQERRRRFLHGEGFVGFPGPTLKDVIDNVVIHNRMLKGGLVINGRTVSLVDMTCPALYFFGTHDAFIRPAAIAAIAEAAPKADCYKCELEVGHFGMVVSGNAAQQSWPTTCAWIHWLEDEGPMPDNIDDARAEAALHSRMNPNATADRRRRGRLWSDAAKATAERLSALVREAGERIDRIKWQAPRVRRMRELRGATRVSMSMLLREQAAADPDGTFFFWKGRAFSYAEADRRVDAVVRGLISCGVRSGERVAVLMERRPSYLSAVAALNRMGAVAVPLGGGDSPELHRYALRWADVHHAIADPSTAPHVRSIFTGQVLVLGGGKARPPLPAEVIDMELIDPEQVPTPKWYAPDAGTGRDLAMFLFTGGRRGEPRAARITNQRWALSAHGGATVAALTPRDTVYCCAGLNHPTGIMVSVGSALVGGARLALADQFNAEAFWEDVRRCGATVVFYAGEMGRELLNVPPSSSDHAHPLRLLCGSGMRADTWRKLQRRFGPLSIVETYGSTEGNAVLANITGRKVGSVGKPIPGSAEIALVRYDFGADEFIRGQDGHLVICGIGEDGVLVSNIDSQMPATLFDGYAEIRPDEERLIKGAFVAGDTWFNTRDVMRRDSDDDYWYGLEYNHLAEQYCEVP